MNDFDDNIFDEDDALDCILLEDTEKPIEERNNRSTGCLGLILLVLAPASFIWFL
ncbi:hypothetical protein [Desulfogranum marinum]|uniref:hypothetical protein n=1 Tax=Desulfogranum marinum TaxID=453220 RepID=UPI001965213E|nr:hypothetical protein [Desulfogranum marinum]MBM9515194.1 hypothetical protein [Desulfogranum marinum]